MEGAAPLVQGGHYFSSTPFLYPAFACPSMTLPHAVCEFVYAPVNRTQNSRPPSSRGSSRDMRSLPSDWSDSADLDRFKTCQAPFDMDTLKAAIQAAKPDNGEVKKAILSSTFKPRERAFTRLINMCGRRKEAHKALEVFATMCECKGVRPNTYTYSALISACSHAGEWDAAIKVYYRMKQAAASDPGCRPNQVTYNAIIAASERGGRYDICLACFRDMLNADACPDSTAYCSAINACHKIGNWTKAEELLTVMHSQHLVANLGIYSTMIDHYATRSEWETALDLFLTMQVLGQDVDTRCCRSLMMAFEAGRQPEMAYQLIQAMWENGISVEMNIYSTALRLMTPAAMWEEAFEMVSKMHDTGNKIPVEAVSMLLQSMKSAGEEDIAREIESMDNVYVQ